MLGKNNIQQCVARPVMVHTCSPSPQEAEAGGLRIEGQPCLHGEILSQLKGAASCGSHLLVPATWRMKGEDHESKASLGKGSSETPSQK
jgi:hypothetical protein